MHLAELCDLSDKTIQLVENGHRGMFLDTAIKLRKVLGFNSVEELIVPLTDEEIREWKGLRRGKSRCEAGRLLWDQSGLR